MNHAEASARGEAGIKGDALVKDLTSLLMKHNKRNAGGHAPHADQQEAEAGRIELTQQQMRALYDTRSEDDF